MGRLDLLKSRLKSLDAVPQLLRIYLLGELEYDNEELMSMGLGEESIPLLEDWRNRLQQLDHFTDEQLEEALRLLAEERGVKAGELIHPTRYAVTASRGGPSLFEVLTFLGREETLKRFNRFLFQVKSDVFSD